MRSVRLNSASFLIYLSDVTGQIFILFVLAMAVSSSPIKTVVIKAFHTLTNSV